MQNKTTDFTAALEFDSITVKLLQAHEESRVGFFSAALAFRIPPAYQVLRGWWN